MNFHLIFSLRIACFIILSLPIFHIQIPLSFTSIPILLVYRFPYRSTAIFLFFLLFLPWGRHVGSAWCGAISDSVIGRGSEPRPPSSPSATLVLLWDTNCAIKDTTHHCIKRTSHWPAFSVVKDVDALDYCRLFALLHSRVLKRSHGTSFLVVGEHHTLRCLGSVKDCTCGCWRPHLGDLGAAKTTRYSWIVKASELRWTKAL